MNVRLVAASCVVACGPAVRAAYRVARSGELYLCRHCTNLLWPAPDLTRPGQLTAMTAQHALPANRLRVATDWFNDVIEHRQFVQLGLIPNEDSGLTAAEHTDIYYQTDGQPLDRQRPT